MSEASSANAPDRAAGRPTYRARVECVFDHAPDIRSLFLRTVEGRLPAYLPGMFISISIALPDEIRVRPYTIATRLEDGEPFEICFNRVPGGAGVAWMFERKVGDELAFAGPFGAFTFERAPDGETVFIAEGTAIAAVRPMVRRALAQGPQHPIHLLYAATAPDRLLYREQLAGLAATHSGFRFETLITGADSGGPYPRLREEVERRWVAADSLRNRHFYVCGIGKGVLGLRDLLRGAGYERRAVRYEMW